MSYLDIIMQLFTNFSLKKKVVQVVQYFVCSGTSWSAEKEKGRWVVQKCRHVWLACSVASWNEEGRSGGSEENWSTNIPSPCSAAFGHGIRCRLVKPCMLPHLWSMWMPIQFQDTQTIMYLFKIPCIAQS